MAKEVSFAKIMSKIVEVDGVIDETAWEELSSLAKGFGQLSDACYWAESYEIFKWRDYFLEKMIEKAGTSGQRLAVVRFSRKCNYSGFNEAVEKAFGCLKVSKSLYGLKNLKRYLKEGHPSYAEVNALIRKIEAERKKEKIKVD